MKRGRARRGNGVNDQAAGAECPGSFLYFEGAAPR
jgi:hypothetical protein